MKIHKHMYYYKFENDNIDYRFVTEEIHPKNNTIEVMGKPKEATKILVVHFEGEWYLFGLILGQWYGYKISKDKVKSFLALDKLSKNILFNDFHSVKLNEFNSLKHTFRG